MKEAARKYGVPWQVVAGVLETELTLDTDFYDRAQDALFRGAPNVGFWIFGHDAGYGLGNIHFETALTVGYYLKQCYGIELPDYTSDPWKLARMLSRDDINIEYIAGIVRYLADYRFGMDGKPLKSSHANIAGWTVADGAAVWHAYRYGINQELSPPYGKGFASVEDFQNRDPSIQRLLDRIQPQENAARQSVNNSVPIFKYYFAQR